MKFKDIKVLYGYFLIGFLNMTTAFAQRQGQKNLDSLPKQIEEIILKAHQREVTSVSAKIHSQQIEQMSGGNLADLTKTIGGVNSINTGNNIAKPIIGGLHSSRVPVNFHGTRLEDQQWGIEHAPNIDLSMVSDIKVIKGASALEYGSDAIGGLLILNPARSFSKDTLYGSSIISGQRNGKQFHINTRIDHSKSSGFFMKATGVFKKAGDFKSPNYLLENTGFESKGASFHTGIKKYRYHLGIFYSFLDMEIGILRAAHVGNTSDLLRAIKGANKMTPSDDFSFKINAPKQTTTHHLLSFKSSYKINDRGKIFLAYHFQYNRRKEFDIRRGKRSNRPANDLQLKTQGINLKLNLKSGALNLTIGSVANYQNNFPNPETGVRRLIPDYDKYDIGAYATADFILDNLILSTGFRYDYQDIKAQKYYLKSRWEERGYDKEFQHFISKPLATQLLTNIKLNYHNTAMVVGVHYHPHEQHQWNFNYSLSTRPPNPSELFSDGLHHAAARIELGDLRIQPETAHQIQAHYQFDSNRLHIEIEGFLNRINDFIYSSPTGITQTLRGSFLIWSYRQTNALIKGVNTKICYHLHPQLTLTNTSAFLRGDDLSNKRPLIDMPPFNSRTALQFTMPNWHHLHLSLESDWNARQDRFPDNNFSVTNITTGEKERVDISTPPPAYHLFNMRLGSEFHIGKLRVHGHLYVNNIANTTYRSYLNRLRYFADDLGRNFNIQLIFNY